MYRIKEDILHKTIHRILWRDEWAVYRWFRERKEQLEYRETRLSNGDRIWYVKGWGCIGHFFLREVEVRKWWWRKPRTVTVLE